MMNSSNIPQVSFLTLLLSRVNDEPLPHVHIKGFEDNYRNIIVVTDNWEAFNVLKIFSYNVPAEAIEPAIQIFIRIHDPR